MGYHHENWLDDTTLEFPRTCFWILHIVSIILIFMGGMRFAVRRAPIPVLGYRLLRMFLHR